MNGRMLLAAGAVVAIASVVIAVPVFGAGPYALVPLMVGALAVAAGAASQKGEANAVSFRRSWKWAVPLVVTGAGWALAHFIDVQIDVTHERVNTLAEESVAVARGLASPVRVVSFVEVGDRADVELKALVERYQKESPQVRFERWSMKNAEGAAAARTFGVAELLPLGGANVVVVSAVDGAQPVRLRFDAGTPSQEEQLTNALRTASTKKTMTTVWIVSGHGEPDVTDAGVRGLAQWRAALLGRGIELVPLPLSVLGNADVLAQGKALVVPPSSSPLSAEEQAALTAFVDRGGALLLLCEPEVGVFQQSLAGRFGVTVVPDVVVEDSSFGALAGGAETIVGSSQMAHPITRPLAGALTHFPHTAALATAPVDGLEVVPLVSTSGEAKLAKTEAHGPMPLVIAADGHLKVGGRAVVAADANFVDNAGLGLGANRDLALNAVLWLVQDNSAITVRPREKTGALLFLTPTSRERLAWILLFLIPVALAAAGAALSARRS